MPLQSSGAISLANIQSEFGGTNPISISEYYAGGGYVPSGVSGTNGAIPSSGTISFSQFYGTTNVYFSNFSVSPSTITYNQPISISWSVVGASSTTFNMPGTAYNQTLQPSVTNPVYISVIRDPNDARFNSMDIDGTDILIVGYNGIVLTSTNSGTTFTKRDLGITTTLGTAKILNSNFWYVLGNSSTAFYSTNKGATWTQVTVPGSIGSRTLSGIDGNSTAGYVMGANPYILYSSDGINSWTVVRDTTADSLSSMKRVKYGGSSFIVVAYDGFYTASTGNGTWTARNMVTNKGLIGALFDIEKVGNRWIAVAGTTASPGYSEILTISSATGASTTGWTRYTLPANTFLNSIKWNGTAWIIVGDSGVVYTSTSADPTAASSWTRIQFDSDFDLEAVSGTSTVFSLSSNGSLSKSTDNGNTWIYPNGGAIYGDTISGAVFDTSNSTYLFCGGSSVVAKASSLTSGSFTRVLADGMRAVQDIASSNQYVVVVGGRSLTTNSVSDLIRASTDGGTTWSTQISSLTELLNSVAAGATYFCAVGRTGGIITRTLAGTSWTVRASGVTTQHLERVVYNSSLGRFYALSQDGTVLYSNESTIATWTAATLTPTTTNTFNGYATSGSIHVIVGTNGVIYRSLSGTTFGPIITFTSEMFLDITYFNGYFYAVTTNGQLFRSSDATSASWIQINTYTTSNINRIFVANNKLVLAGENGAILVYNGSQWEQLTISPFQYGLINNFNVSVTAQPGNITQSSSINISVI